LINEFGTNAVVKEDRDQSQFRHSYYTYNTVVKQSRDHSVNTVPNRLIKVCMPLQVKYPYLYAFINGNVPIRNPSHGTPVRTFPWVVVTLVLDR
jgi:hypothetical protein